ncbi:MULTISPECIES: helix-turn-helix transcriptional regulator [Streptomyces]|uniref:Helix-turn-helix transcriptional regulator n=1 Tax=Streptomyces lonegramiae TaxID=3075524 RepID=A0ABU2XMU5_9ACTN|nr:helix-turn-helix transcriptional regulator [Streptomyces sp. DSM 41529]MDT0546779.1 helix-turn-helix transcriptional regulator [Streptomyces sp. DSM 41529]
MSYHPVPTVRRRRLGSTLRKLRTEAGMTLDAAAEALNAAQRGRADARRWSAPKLSRIENANATIRATEVATLLEAYAISDAEVRAALERLAKDAGKRGWWQTYRGVVAPAYADYISLESDAERVRDYAPLVVPGLLQTPDYARETIAANAVARTEAEVAALAEVRLARQAVLTRPRAPLLLWAVIHEAALHRRFAGRPAIMTEQLRRLRDVADWPTVTLQVMPIDAAPNPGDAGAFTLVGFPGPMPDVVTQENLRGPVYVEGVDDVNVFADAFGHIVDSALSPDETKALLDGLVGKRAPHHEHPRVTREPA